MNNLQTTSASGLQVFNFETNINVRTIAIDNEPWFVGKDIAEALGYKDTVTALKDHVDHEDKNTMAIYHGIPGNPNMIVINESGVYSLIFGSKLKSAKRFKRWVTNEVLPSIRKTGGYQVPQTYLEAMKLAVSQQELIEVQTKRLEEAQPKLAYMEKYVSIDDTKCLREAAQILGIPERTFTRWLHDNNVIYRQGGAWLPRSTYRDKGYFVVKTGGNGNKVWHQTRVTPLGLERLASKFNNTTQY